MIDKIEGCLFGLALGDGLGAQLEFLSFDEIRHHFQTPDSLAVASNEIQVTDDTQMAIAVGEALLAVPCPYQPDTITPVLIRRFVEWYQSPDNNRAPGMTCLQSVEKLMQGQQWQQATDIRSKGSGANMRVQPVGLLPVDHTMRSALAQVQAALTHGHPVGLAAADLTAWVIADLLNEGDISTLLKRMREYIARQRRIYHQSWLGELYTRALVFPTGTDFIEHGWDACLVSVDHVEDALRMRAYEADPATWVGQGWVAEEAFASALYCFLLHPDEPMSAIRRAAMTDGDSDTVACITGAFAGTYTGISGLPEAQIRQLEYQELLARIATGIHTMWKEVQP